MSPQISSKNCVVITSENLASNAITSALIAECKLPIKHIFILPNMPTKGKTNRNRAKRLVNKTAWQFIVFKACEIFASTLIRICLRSTIASKAKKAGIATTKFSSPDSPELLDKLRELNCDILISSGPSILSRELLDIPRQYTLNCHCARLPEYQGPANYFWMTLDKVDKAFVAIQLMAAEIDTGPVIAEDSIVRNAHWSVYQFNWYLARFAGKFYTKTILKILYDNTFETQLFQRQNERALHPQNRGFPGNEDFKKLRAQGTRLIRFFDVLRFY